MPSPMACLLLAARPAFAPFNLAVGKTATQSSDYDPSFNAGNAVDGSTDNFFPDGSFDFSHTSTYDMNSYWCVSS